MERFRPLWAKDYVENEILVFVKRGEEISANLAFDGAWGLRLKDRKGTVLRECVDFKIEGRKVIALNDCIDYFEEAWLKNENVPEYIENENERYNIGGCLLVSPEYLRKKQYLVSYRHAPALISGLFPDRISLPRIYKKISEKQRLKIALTGDSISNAANSSYEMGFKGYRHWLDNTAERVKKYLKTEISYENISRSGYGTEWALSVAEEKFKNGDFDLVIIAFGMNDGAAGMTAESFKKNVSELREIIKRLNPEAEFILVSTPLPNRLCPETFKTQPAYYGALKTLECDGTAVLGMTAASEFLLGRKDYAEISGNNLNHPNDFFYEFYSDAFTELFARLKEETENRLDWSIYAKKPGFEEIKLKNAPGNLKSGFIVDKVNGKTRKTFCFIASPRKDNGKTPAVVLVHGAGGNAYAEWACAFAERGYTALSLDTNATRFEGDFGGERKDNPFAVPQDTGGFGNMDENPRDNWIYGSVAQIISAASYLKSLKNVDENKVGVAGISWGGVLTLVALGECSEFAAGAVIYSGGFITEDVLGKQTGIFSDYVKKRVYDTRFDPAAYAKNVNVPVLMTAGFTDGAFSPLNRKRTYDLFRVKPRFAFLPYILHDNESNFRNENVFEFMDKELKGEEGKSEISVEISDGTLYLKTDKPYERAEMYYCGEREDMRSAEWITEELNAKNGKKIPKNARYVCVTVFFGNGVFKSSDIIRV